MLYKWENRKEYLYDILYEVWKDKNKENIYHKKWKIDNGRLRKAIYQWKQLNFSLSWENSPFLNTIIKILGR